MNSSLLNRKVAIIPVYNEIRIISKVINKFDKKYVDEICIVIDNPSELILKEIKESAKGIIIPIKIIKNPRRMGIGYAIRKGIFYAISNYFTIIVVMSGSNKDNPKEITKFLKKIVNEDYDYVQGSRFLPGGKSENLPFMRKIIVRIYPFLWTIVSGRRCTDVTNGFRAYKTRIFLDKRINICQNWLNDYSLEYYIHYKVLKLGYKIIEVPVSKIYPTDIRGSYTKINPIKDFWSILSPLIYLFFGLKK